MLDRLRQAWRSAVMGAGLLPVCWVKTAPVERRRTLCGGSELSLLGQNHPCGGSEHVLWRVGTSPHLAYILLRGRWCGVDYASRRKGFMYLINIL